MVFWFTARTGIRIILSSWTRRTAQLGDTLDSIDSDKGLDMTNS